MTLDVAVQVPSSPSPDAPQDIVVLVLLHSNGHFRLLERTLRDFRHLERQLQLKTKLSSISSSIEAYYGVKTSFYPSNQLGFRLAIALENFINQLVANSELLTTCTAFKMFFHGNLLTSHELTGPSYREAVESALQAEEKTEIQERVAAGCSLEHQVAVDMDGEKQFVLWKFASQGTGLVFSAEFSNEKERDDVDPYSVSSNDVTESERNDKEVAHYRTNCDFKVDGEDEEFVYGHFVAEKSGAVTLQWENVDMSSVVSKPLRFQVKVVPLTAAVKVLEVTNGLNAVDTAKWLQNHVDDSEITSIEDLPGWGNDESEDSFGEDAYDEFAGEGPEQDSQIQSAVLEERTHELEAQVMRLEESLVATKKELKSAMDRVQIAEEIYKANLETITQLECVPKSSQVNKTQDTLAPPAATATQPEGPPSSELERVQKLCAGFQEQCLWRSVENMELEAQLAGSQVEASSWREKHVEQAAQLVELQKQNLTLRTHKKMLVQEVKRLQPYSQVNLAALVQEAQEARMVQRSLQAKLDSHNNAEVAETGPTDFVLVEASDNESEQQ